MKDATDGDGGGGGGGGDARSGGKWYLLVRDSQSSNAVATRLLASDLISIQAPSHELTPDEAEAISSEVLDWIEAVRALCVACVIRCGLLRVLISCVFGCIAVGLQNPKRPRAAPPVPTIPKPAAKPPAQRKAATAAAAAITSRKRSKAVAPVSGYGIWVLRHCSMLIGFVMMG